MGVRVIAGLTQLTRIPWRPSSLAMTRLREIERPLAGGAGEFDASGKMVGSARHDIELFQAPGGIAEQLSEDIWLAVSASVRGAVAQSGGNFSV